MGIRILVIEDEAEIADFLVRGLREEAFTVEHSPDGASGWHALRTMTWDLVLLDWWLPCEDGLSLLRRFRVFNRETPVLFLTARDAVSDRVRGLDGGADDYLCKPFAFEELLARIRVMARRQDTHHSTPLRYQDVQIDLATQRAERAGKRFDLTAGIRAPGLLPAPSGLKGGRKEEACAVFQQGRVLLLVNERGDFAIGRMTEARKLTAKEWGDLVGEVSKDGKEITWSNNSTWRRG